MTVSEFPIAELIAVRRWACDTSGVRINMPQKITLYRTPICYEYEMSKFLLRFANFYHVRLPTKLRHNTIQSGTNTTSHDQVTRSSSFNGKNTNWSAFTAIKSSNSNERSCFTDQTQAPTLATLPNIKGTNTIIHNGRVDDVKRSHASNSNISKIRWSEKEINIAL